MTSRRPIDPEHWLYRATPEGWLEQARLELSRGVDFVVYRNLVKALPRLRAAVHCAINAMLASQSNADDRFGRTAIANLRFIAADGALDASVRNDARWLLEVTSSGDGDYVLRSAGEWHLLRQSAISLVAFAEARVVDATA